MYSSNAETDSFRHSAIGLVIDDNSQVGEARRAATALGRDVGMSEVERGSLALVVTEAANNLIRHAGGGRIILQPVAHSVRPGWVDVFSLDTGPGMRSVANSLRDGHSTAGTAGQGLGAIVRLSTAFDVFSAPERGTVLFARLGIGAQPLTRETEAFAWGVLSLPAPGETVCGDAWAVQTADDANGADTSLRFLVADGLGHGTGASEASSAAVAVFGEARTPGAAQTLQAAHAALRPTRGAAAAIAYVDATSPNADLVFAGVGNIQASLMTEQGDMRGLVSYNGIIGHQAYKFAELRYELPRSSLLLMASDGLTTQWHLDRYPGLLNRHPAVIAGVLYRDYCRGRDDATILVAAPFAHKEAV